MRTNLHGKINVIDNSKYIIVLHDYVALQIFFRVTLKEITEYL
jgi:hypothetical protein